MKRKSLLLLGLILLFSSFVSGCDKAASGIISILASPTPTATSTPAYTATPTIIPSATATPRPPLTLIPCPGRGACADTIKISDLVEASIESGVEYPVTVPYNATVSIKAGWIAQDQSTLQQNLMNMTPFLEIDGQPYFVPAYLGMEPYTDGDGNENFSSWIGVAFSGWKMGEVHRIRLGYTINQKLTDGWDVYEPGTVIEYLYIISPADIPTATLVPSETPTRTPAPTNTPRPRATAVPVTPTVSCSVDSSILIENNTGGTLTLYLSGQAKFTFYVKTGNQTIAVCAGSYSYTAYGCGGASRNGTMSSGEEHEFWCE